MKFASLFAGLVLLCSCAQVPTQGPDDGRYYQWVHPISGAVAFQMAMPNAQGCSFLLKTAIANPKAAAFSNTLRCSLVSASKQLDAIGTIRNKTYNFVVDVEAISVDECQVFIDSVIRSAPIIEQVAPCKAKDAKAA
jgi:hypothetical protein